MAEQLSLRGTLEGHSGWVTSIATPLDVNSDIVLSSSRYVGLSLRMNAPRCHKIYEFHHGLVLL
jgi:hypothetical protein